ncbi:hypothetical protein ACLOJK_000908 [Asimina triloba]
MSDISVLNMNNNRVVDTVAATTSSMRMMSIVAVVRCGRATLTPTCQRATDVKEIGATWWQASEAMETMWQQIADVWLGGVHAGEGGRGSGERRCKRWRRRAVSTDLRRGQVVASKGSLDRSIQASVVAIAASSLTGITG